jgi:drug/metabolite transporter (DMT)-like permease
MTTTHPVFSQRKVVLLLATFTCLLWGSSYPAIKNGYAMFAIDPSDIPSKMVFAGYRFLFAGLLLLMMALLMRRDGLKLTKARLIEYGVLGLTQTSIMYMFFYIGLSHTSGMKSSIMNATGTFFSVLLAHFIYRNERLSFNKALGCLIGFAGVMVVNFNQDLLDFSFSLLGEGFVVIAAFIQSAATIYGKKLSQKVDSVVLTGYQLAIGGAILVVVGYAMGGVLTGFTWASSSLLLYMILLSAVSFAIWTVLLKYNPVGAVTVFNFSIPIFGTALSALFLGESVWAWKNVFALVLVCGGIWMVTREVGRSNESAPAKLSTGSGVRSG